MANSINLSEILSTTTNFVENGERAQSIYVNEIFYTNGVEMSFKQKRDTRRKLRRKLEDIITSWNIATKTKKTQNLPEIYTAWSKFKAVYKNENIIYSGYKKEYAEMCKAFLKAYAEWLAGNKKQKTTKAKKETKPVVVPSTETKNENETVK